MCIRSLHCKYCLQVVLPDFLFRINVGTPLIYCRSTTFRSIIQLSKYSLRLWSIWFLKFKRTYFLRIMQVEDLPTIDPDVDYTQILPIQQKRTIAFVNHFVMNTVSFLNKFAQSCESRLMEFEYKLEKVEANLLILESQLSSISGLQDEVNDKVENVEKSAPDSSVCELPEVQVEQKPLEKPAEQQQQSEGPPACDDVRFKKFFKMLQFGVPPPAIKLKMQSEGIDPNILDTPNIVIPGYSPNNEDNVSVTSSNVS